MEQDSTDTAVQDAELAVAKEKEAKEKEGAPENQPTGDAKNHQK